MSTKDTFSQIEQAEEKIKELIKTAENEVQEKIAKLEEDKQDQLDNAEKDIQDDLKALLEKTHKKVEEAKTASNQTLEKELRVLSQIDTKEKNNAVKTVLKHFNL